MGSWLVCPSQLSSEVPPRETPLPGQASWPGVSNTSLSLLSSGLGRALMWGTGVVGCPRLPGHVSGRRAAVPHGVHSHSHLSRALFPRCHPSASPEKPPPSRACTPSWARHPVPVPTSCPRIWLTGRTCPSTSPLCPGRLFWGAWPWLEAPSPSPQHLPRVSTHPISLFPHAGRGARGRGAR